MTEHSTTQIDSLEDYDEHIREEISKLRKIADDARSNGEDPADHVEIGQARDIAERCEKLLQEELTGIDGLQDKIRHYENETDLDREQISFKIADAFVEGDLGSDLSKEERVEAAIRVAVALLTEGVVAAPLEGIEYVTLEKNDDGTDYIRVYYNGPIRSAGGTGQALSVLVADHVRQKLGISAFKPRDNEVQRYKEEIKLYDDENGLQYLPKDKEIITIIDNCPIMLDGMGTTDKETSAYRDLERIDTNSARGGVCLVAAEGIAQKAPKIQRIVDDIDIDNWGWLTDLPTVNIEDEEETEDDTDSDSESSQTTSMSELTSVETTDYIDPTVINEQIFDPSDKYMKKLPAGRPLYASPSTDGGFRLRYGRARNTGIAASGFHPATMVAMEDSIATGMQHKTERPGKAQGTSPVDSIEGPTVKLYDGTVKTLQTEKEAKEAVDKIESIIDVGEILINYGEFRENNHPLGPSPYVSEWWIQDLENAGMPTKHLDINKIDFQTARELSNNWNVPLLPKHTYLFSDITAEEVQQLGEQLETAQKYTGDDNYDYTMETTPTVTNALETLLCPHKQENEETILLAKEDYERLNYYTQNIPETIDTNKSGLEIINETITETLLPRATIRIGSRMGRPEKTDIRQLKGKIQGLYPVGDLGGKQRKINKAALNTEGSNRDIETGATDYSGKGVTRTRLNNRYCEDCEKETWRVKCPECNNRTELVTKCGNCGDMSRPELNGEDCDACRTGTYYLASNKMLNVNTEFENALNNLGLHPTQVGEPSGVRGLSSVQKTPEPLEKGLLRSKYDLYPFRDGTIRYDMVDLPLTSFKISEIKGLTVEKANEIGYTTDIHGNELTNETQLTEIYPQDIVVSEDAGEIMLNVANYIDELLEKYYGLDSYYNAEKPEDLIGELVMGLAPHTSASVAARIIGYTDSKAQYGHPLFHASKRRNCFAPDTELTYKLNGEWNRSTIQELVETHLQSDSDGYDDNYTDGSIVQHIDNHPEIEELKVPSMTDDGFRTLEDVSALSKHQPTEQMVTLHFDDGTDLTVTPDHNIPTKSDDKEELFNSKEASDVEKGDYLYDYSDNTLNRVKNYQEFDMLEELVTTDNIDHDTVMLRGLDKDELYDLFEVSLKPDWDGRFYALQSTADYLDMNKKTLSNYLYRDSFPLSILLEIYEGDYETLLEEMPRDITLGIKRDNTDVPRFLTLDEELACLLGYYTAEGFTRFTNDDTRGKNTTGVRQVDFAATEEQARVFIEETLEKKFNLENPYKEENRITVSGTLITHFFNTIVDSGRLAHTKKVPQIIKDASKETKGAYLSGYISGDGTVLSNQLRMSTVSETLYEEVCYLFDELGYRTTTRKRDGVPLHKKFPDYYEEDDSNLSRDWYEIEVNAAARFVEEYGVQLQRKQEVIPKHYSLKRVTNVEFSESVENTYNLTVPFVNRLEAVSTIVEQCDGDEDSVMLLMDGFLNFSKQFLPDSIGKRTMDAPLIMTTIIDPSEVDDEAHMVDTVSEYPREFYMKTWDTAGPKEFDIPIIEDMMDNTRGIGHTSETSSINGGPYSCAYSILDGMDTKVKLQLDLARRTRGVDEKVVASKVVASHFFPDIRGNLRAFAQQDFRCTTCETKYRRLPLTGECTECDNGGNLIFTVYEGMVTKYMQPTLDIAETYEMEEYVRQQLDQMQEELDSIFKKDTEEQTGLEDFI